MKNLFLTLAALSLVLMAGCQENMTNEPAGVLMKSENNVIAANFIKLNREIRDPLFGICKLTGRVTFSHQVINRAMNPIGLSEISLQINMDSVLDDMLGMAHLEWRVQGRSSEIVFVSEEGILLLEKSYPITNRIEMVLLVQYLVTTNGVGISSVSLVPLEK